MSDIRKPGGRIRQDFPATERWTYLDVAARGILSQKVRESLEWYLDDAMANGATKDLWFDAVEKARERFARLINAQPSEIASTKNVSEGLNIIANAIPWEPGDNVIFCPELEHPNNVYPWLNLQRRGIEGRLLPARDGRIDPEAVERAIDGRTRMVTVSSVTFSPGNRTDIDRIGRICRDRDIFFLVDAAQSVGVLHTDVEKSYVDGLATPTHKGLLGIYGMGFLYCRKEWADRLHPASLARFSVDLEGVDHDNMGDFDYKLLPGARRFDIGNYNYAAAIAVNASLEMLLEIGSRAIEEHVTKLTHRLASGLSALGLPVRAGLSPSESANIVTVGRWSAGEDNFASEVDFGRLSEYLAEHAVKHSIRRGLLRFSFHIYNTEEDVDRVLDLVSQTFE